MINNWFIKQAFIINNPHSFLGINGKDGIKKVIQDYSKEKKLNL